MQKFNQKIVRDILGAHGSFNDKRKDGSCRLAFKYYRKTPCNLQVETATAEMQRQCAQMNRILEKTEVNQYVHMYGHKVTEVLFHIR